MSHVQDATEELEQAADDIRRVLATPKRSGEMIHELGHSVIDRWCTIGLGDGRGEWDNCPHQLALSDLMDQGEIVWWRNEKLDVWYGLKGTEPEGGTGDDSSAVKRIETFLEAVGNLLGEPRFTPDGDYAHPSGDVIWQMPYFNVLEVDTGGNGTRSVNIDGEIIMVICYDFICGFGADEADWEAKWPGPTVAEVAEEVRKALTAENENG